MYLFLDVASGGDGYIVAGRLEVSWQRAAASSSFLPRRFCLAPKVGIVREPWA